ALRAASKLPERHRARIHGDPREVILDKTERLIGRKLTEQQRGKAKPALPFVYGASGPLVLGLIAGRLGRGSIGRTLAAGAVMGTLVWAAGYLGWLPATGVAEPIHRQPPLATASNLLGHAAYGVLSS